MSTLISLSDQAKAALDFARRHGLTGLEKLMLSSRNAMPSVEELKAELGCDLFEQYMSAEVVHDPDYAAA